MNVIGAETGRYVRPPAEQSDNPYVVEHPRSGSLTSQQLQNLLMQSDFAAMERRLLAAMSASNKGRVVTVVHGDVLVRTDSGGVSA